MTKNKKSFIIKFLLLFLINILYFLSDLIPENITEVDLYFFKIGTFGFIDISTFISCIRMNLLILSYSIIWYLTNKFWWRSAILIIVIIELAKTLLILNPYEFMISEFEYITSLPITIPIICLIFYISIKLYFFNKANKLKKKLDIEIATTIKNIHNSNKTNNSIENLEEELNFIKKSKNNLSESEYLTLLSELKNKILKE